MTTTDQELRQRLADAVERFGPWEPPHNIRLGGDVWTITDKQPVENSKLRRMVQLTADLAPRPLDELRVLDLACEGGVYGIELARLGAEVVGVEGRQEHVERARFVKDAIDLDTYEIFHDDVRNVTRLSHGEFDVVLCLGILYHLDAPDVFEFVHSIADLCSEFAIIDTVVGLSPKRSHEFRGHEYWGCDYTEHPPDSSPEERERRLRASLDNPTSFWPTLPSLFNLLADAGFTSVLQAQMPRPLRRHADRVTLVANNGERMAVPRSSGVEDPPVRWPERERLARVETGTADSRLRRLVSRALGR